MRRPILARTALIAVILGVAGALTLAQAGLATAKGEPEPRIRGAGQLSASSTTFQFSIDLRLKSSGDLKASFSLKEVGAPKSERFTLDAITSLVLSDDQAAGNPCSGISNCDTDWNTADLVGTGKLGSTDGYSVTLIAVDGGVDASTDRLTVEIRDPSDVVVLSIVGAPSLGTGLRARHLLPLPLPGSNIVQDHFEDTDGTPLESHAADVDVLGGGWDEQAYREWFIGSDQVSNLAGAQSPFYAISDAGLINIEIKADVTWTVGEVGLLFRYQDTKNHWQFVYDGDRKLLLRKVVAGVTTTVAHRNFKWGKSGRVRKLSVTLEDGDILAKVGNSSKFDITDPTHEGETRHGLYFKLQQTATVDNFTIASLGGIPGVPPPLPLLPDIADSLVFDTFSEGSVIGLASHTPDKDTGGSGWQTGGALGSGTWTAGTSTATEIVGAAADVHAIIDAGSADIDTRVDITWDDPASKPGGVGLTGIVLRYENEGNWIKLWFDGVTELILAKFVTPEGGSGTFTEMGRVSVDWRPGETHRLRVKRNGNGIRIYEDTDSLLMLRIDTDLATSTKAGLFARNLDTSTFDNFVITNSAPLLEPDPDPPPPGPSPTPTPTPPAAPADADFYDSFTGFNGFALDGRPPDVDPLGLGWTIDSGFWQLRSLSAREFRGTERDFRATIDSGVGNQLVDAALTWHSGRAGIAFRYRNESNWMMVWFDGKDLILAKNTGGQFKEIDRDKFKWGEPGKTHRFRIAAIGRHGRIFVDGKLLFRFTEEELQLNGRAGLFYRADIGSLFDDFTVTAKDPQPAPAITSLTPNPQDAGSGNFTLTVDGSNFTQWSVVSVDGNTRTTTYISPGQVTAAALGTDVSTAGTASITVDNGVDRGGVSGAAILSVENAVPAITDSSLTKPITDPDGSLTVNGTGFVTTSVGRIDGADRTTAFVSGTQITITLLTSDFDTFGTSTVTVFTPAPGGGVSNSVILTVENAMPLISSLQTSPSVVAEGESSATLTIIGTGFVSGATVSVGGASRSATTSSSTEMVLILTSGDLDTAGRSPVTVFNPAPGGGTSTAIILPIASVHDTFTAGNGTDLHLRAPDAAPGSSTWIDENGVSGGWEIQSGQATDTTGAGAGDRRVVIEGGDADIEVSADVTWNGGLVGLVVRYQNSTNWVQAWFDGADSLVIGRLVSGSFSELKRQAGLSWGSTGDTHAMTLTADGDDITLAIEGVGSISTTLPTSMTATGVGLLENAGASNFFDNFVVVPLAAP